MSGNSITLKSVASLEGMKFYIPAYQRGYRWSDQQVKDLLNDIAEYSSSDGGFYCMQPLVVKERSTNIFHEIKTKARDLDEVKQMIRGRWEVIDGQQRLTTLFIILKCLNDKVPWHIEYETRKGSSEFLNSLGNNETDRLYDNIDFYHIARTHSIVKDWLESRMNANAGFNRKGYVEKIRDHVNFIWYESVDENPIRVFTRLNIGKISLTNAELIKALLLKSTNYNSGDVELLQKQTALQWDRIEYALQSDDFWLFLNQPGYEKPTRIDLIFEFIKEKDLLSLDYRNDRDMQERIGSDDYSTFRYFYEFFRNTGSPGEAHRRLEKCWDEVKRIFETFSEWFNDTELYHYTGFLIATGAKLPDLLDEWNSAADKNAFVDKLTVRIKRAISRCRDLDRQYELNNIAKTECRPLLLLHNVQSIINQASNSDNEYSERMFLKFPFHLYKLEKWDVEHIDSNTENPLESEKHRKEWLLYSLLDPEVAESDSLKSKIEAYLGKKESEKDADEFQSLYKTIVELSSNPSPLSNEDKNKVGNFVLLDSTTNRGYGNAIFPVKRRIIIGKDRGQKFEIKLDENKKPVIDNSLKAGSAFIPPCTKYAFLKYYNINSAGIKHWDSYDADAYRQNIFETLRQFDVIDSAKKENTNE